jgi:hypothetical protein
MEDGIEILLSSGFHSALSLTAAPKASVFLTRQEGLELVWLPPVSE